RRRVHAALPDRGREGAGPADAAAVQEVGAVRHRGRQADRDGLTTRLHQEVSTMTHRTADGLGRWASLAALAFFACHSSAADPEWKVGLAEVKITPDRPVPMAGYASRNKLSEAV